VLKIKKSRQQSYQDSIQNRGFIAEIPENRHEQKNEVHRDQYPGRR